MINWRGFKGSGLFLAEVLRRYFIVRSEENTKILSGNLALRPRFEASTSGIPT